nr:hypothetical protein [Prolixibacteraceae bacterium]
VLELDPMDAHTPEAFLHIETYPGEGAFVEYDTSAWLKNDRNSFTVPLQKSVTRLKLQQKK